MSCRAMTDQEARETLANARDGCVGSEMATLKPHIPKKILLAGRTDLVI
jgi:hypothetical protein